MGVSGQRHAPAALNPREWTAGTHWIGGWVGIRAGLDTEARGKILCHCRGSNPGRPVCSQTLCWLSYPGSKIKKTSIDGRVRSTMGKIWNIGLCKFGWKRSRERTIGILGVERRIITRCCARCSVSEEHFMRPSMSLCLSVCLSRFSYELGNPH
jgi:hypothetical protein